MSRTILYAILGVIGGFFIGILINQWQPFFPSLLLLFIPALLGGLLSIFFVNKLQKKNDVASGSKRQILLPLLILIIVIGYVIYYVYSLRPVQKELESFIDNEQISVEEDREELQRLIQESLNNN